MAILITLSYKLRAESTSVLLTLTPEDYFDPLDENETFEEHGIPRFNHTWEYLDIDPKDLEWSELQVQGTTEDRRFRTQYFPDGESWLNHRENPDGFEEIIINTQIRPDLSHVLRVHKTTEQPWTVNYSGVFEDFPDGSQREIRIDKPHLTH